MAYSNFDHKKNQMRAGTSQQAAADEEWLARKDFREDSVEGDRAKRGDSSTPKRDRDDR